tara:strand:- start:332 stop:898 length:567 start_codon:yes stop_codon:yes gene_type:complete
MASYKIALKLHQDQYGSEDAKVKITVDDVDLVAEHTVTPTSATTTTFDWTSSKEPNEDGSVTVKVKVTLLNDLYVDGEGDRNVHWTAFGYNEAADDDKFYSKTVTHDGGDPGEWSASTPAEVSDWTADASYNWSSTQAVATDSDGYNDGFASDLASADVFYPVEASADQVTCTMALKVAAIATTHVYA